MNKENAPAKGKQGKDQGSILRLLAFPIGMAVVYGLIAVLSPSHAVKALKASAWVLLQIAPALVVAFGVMVILNFLVTPAHIKRFLGKGASIKGALLSSVAGILSMGPIYAWHPLLKSLREKGVSDFHLANFLGCRAVKIPLMPMMAAYFGWKFTLVVSVLMVADAILTGFIVNATGRSTP